MVDRTFIPAADCCRSVAVLFQSYQKEKKNEKNEIILISTSRQLWRLQTVGKVYLLNKLMYIYEKVYINLFLC